MNLCFLLISFSISANSVQVDLRPRPLPRGGLADATTFVRNCLRERWMISRSRSASVARSSSNFLPLYLDNWDPALAYAQGHRRAHHVGTGRVASGSVLRPSVRLPRS